MVLAMVANDIAFNLLVGKWLHLTRSADRLPSLEKRSSNQKEVPEALEYVGFKALLFTRASHMGVGFDDVMRGTRL